RMDAAGTRPDEVRRAVQRSEALLGAMDEAVPANDARLAAALGWSRRVRECAGQLEECLLALNRVGEPGGSGVGHAEGRLRVELDEIMECVQRERARISATRQALLDARPYVDRIAVGRRSQVGEQLDACIAAFPDLGTGADLGAQHQMASAVVARVRAASSADSTGSR
ncbi:MAG: hypothetical protein H0W83_16070, partial [Planctomycetes bacterium]|nr:hypothetical protein [Planctomycetota bacterium]